MVPVALIVLAVVLRQMWQLERYYDTVAGLLALGLAAWIGFVSANTQLFVWPVGLLLNPLIVGLICTRRPIAFGLLASLAVTISITCSFIYSGDSSEIELKKYGGWAFLAHLALFGMALSLIPTVPIALYRRYFSIPHIE